MQDIEPYYNWRHLYESEEDKLSPFYKRTHSEFEFIHTVYNFYIHPQWDDFGSKTLYMKIIFVNYESAYAVIELLGEWNDAIENDIMTMRREIMDDLFAKGIRKFILIAESVLNFHSSDDSYYEDWYENVKDDDGWIAILNMPSQSEYDFKNARLQRYVYLTEMPQWRTYLPEYLLAIIEGEMSRRIA